jgi:hypothetical protein
MKKTFLLLSLIVVIFLVGCSKTNTAHTFTEAEARSYIKEAIINLNKTSNFEATSTMQILINGNLARTKSGELILNSSNAYSVSMIEESSSKKSILKRVILDGVIYEYDSNKGTFNEITQDQFPMSLYNYYKSNKSLVLDFINQIYSESLNSFGEFLKDLTFEKEIKDKNGPVLVFSYKETKETEISNIEQSGEVYISHYNGEAIISQVKDTYHVVFKKDGTTADTITEGIINNISSAKKIEQPDIN